MKSVFLGGTAAETADPEGCPGEPRGGVRAAAWVKNQFIVAGDDDDRGERGVLPARGSRGEVLGRASRQLVFSR